MSSFNLNTGYGRLQAEALQMGRPGKVFVVGKSALAHRDIYTELFGNDPDGKERFFSTVDAAIGACTANAGDTIFVLPGHTETVTTTSVAHDVAGVSVIGLGQGLNRPTFTYGAADATITISGANGRWKNCHFIANFDNVAAAFTLGAAKDFVLEDCTFVDNSASLHFLSIVVTGTTDNDTDGLQVLRNSWYALALAPNAFISILAAEKLVRIEDNFCDMAATNDVGHFVTLAAKIVSGIRIARNRLVVVGSTAAAAGIFLTGSGTTSTGIVENNYVASLDTTSELITTANTGLKFFENYYTGTADASGKLWPVVDLA